MKFCWSGDLAAGLCGVVEQAGSRASRYRGADPTMLSTGPIWQPGLATLWILEPNSLLCSFAKHIAIESALETNLRDTSLAHTWRSKDHCKTYKFRGRAAFVILNRALTRTKRLKTPSHIAPGIQHYWIHPMRQPRWSRWSARSSRTSSK